MILYHHEDMAFDARLLGGLSVFNAVAETGSFVGAGASLGLTQSGVSRSIQRLEERLATRLFVRSPRAVTLTSEGRRFYEEVKPLLGHLEEAADRTSGASSSVRGLLRINVDATFARLVIGAQIGKFMGLHPDLSVEVCVRSELGDLIGEGFDAALRFGEPAPSALIARRIARTRVLTCAAPNYLKRKGRPSEPADLKTGAHECILFSDPATGRPFPWEFHRGRKVITASVAGRLTFDDGMSHLAACLAGAGVAQVFDLGITEHLKAGRLVDLFPDWSDEMFPLYIYFPSRHYIPAKVRAFETFVMDTIPKPTS
jgi:DNA-binding transcriptional LysR family regulator